MAGGNKGVRRNGAALIALAALAAAALTAFELVPSHFDLAGFRAALRATARLSLALFVLAFIASSINELLSGPASKLLLRYRKYLGNAFAASHIIHLGTIFALMAAHSEVFFAERSIPSLLPGVVVYSFIAAMVITSLPGPARALGRRRWVILHKTGMYAIWAIFFASTAQKIERDPLYAIPVGVLVAALGLRGLARLSARRRRARRSTADRRRRSAPGEAGG